MVQYCWTVGWLTTWSLASVVGLGALLARSRLPLVALAGTGAMSLVHLTVTTAVLPALPVDAAPAIALFTVAAGSTARRISYAALVCGVGGALVPRLLGYPLQYGGPWTGMSLVPPVAMAVAWLIGDRVRIGRAYLSQATQRAVDLERERDQKAELAAAAERARIARELHDAVAHGLSVIVIQAHAGASAMDRKPDTTRAALAAIAGTRWPRCAACSA